MSNTLEIVLIVFIVLCSVLCVYLIRSLAKLNATLEIIGRDIHSLAGKAFPVMDNLNDLSRTLISLAEKAEGKVEDLEALFESIRNKFSFITNFANIFKSGTHVEAGARMPEFIANLSGLFKGIFAFFAKIKK